MMNTKNTLFLDIENTPIRGTAWAKYQTDLITIDEPSYMLCCGFKWLGENKTIVRSLPDYPLYKKSIKDDRALLKEVQSYLCKADTVIGHNIDKFDKPKINARLLYHGLLPPTKYRTIDTYKVASKFFKLESNGLNYLGKYLNLGEKANVGGIETWEGCMRGDAASWKKMTSYNAGDIDLLEKVYYRLEPWITSAQKVSVPVTQMESCDECRCTLLRSLGYVYLKESKYRKVQCTRCGKIMKDSYSERVFPQ